MTRLIGSIFAVLAIVLSVLSIAPEVEAQDRIVIDERTAISSDVVVNATVTSVLNIELDGLPHTVHEVDVDSVVEGSAPSRIFVSIPGGQRSDGATVLLSNSAPFLKVGARVQLGLEPASSTMSAVVAASTGGSPTVFTIVNGESGVAGALFMDGSNIERAETDFAFNPFVRPDFQPPANFRINTSRSGLPADVTRQAVRNGFDRWEDDRFSSVDFTYLGTTNKSGLDLTDSVTTVSWEAPSEVNQLRNSLAVAISIIIGDSWEWDVILSTNYQWSIGAVPGRFDIETTIAHEAGHGIGLGHVSARSEVMFMGIPPATVKELGPGDLAGVRQLYPGQSSSAVVEPGHSVSANTLGHVAIAAVKNDGRLQVQRDLGSGLSGWTTLGASDWVSADIAISPSGLTSVVGVKEDGRMFTRQWATNGTWGGWVQHSGVWDGTSMPSIAMNTNKTVISAVTTSGQFQTRVRTSSWGSFVTHGQPGWAQGDVDVAADGDIWFVAVKEDGRLYVRKNIAGRWSGFARQGLATWSPNTAPAIAANSGGAVYGAVKTDGRLYTRRQLNGTWRGYARQGLNGWASVDIALSENGVAWLAAEKTWGRLYVREATGGDSWRGWSKQGLDTWSEQADPSITIGAGSRPTFFAVKDAGRIYLRQKTSAGWAAWVGDSASDWASGQ